MTKKATRGTNQRELPFAAFDAVRAARRKRMDELVAHCGGLTPTLKRMLQALHARCGNRQFCWPSLRTLARDLGYEWPQAKRTLTRQISKLVTDGLLTTEPRARPDGSRASNAYCIRYAKLRAKQAEPIPRKSKTHNSEHSPRSQNCLQVSTKLTTGVDNSVHSGSQDCLRVSTVVSTHELNGITLNSNRTTTKGDASEKKFGGGDKEFQENKKPSGWWAGSFNDLDLKTKSIAHLYAKAHTNGVIAHSKLNCVRFVAMGLHVSRLTDLRSVTGYFIRQIEQRAWDRLSAEDVTQAIQRCGPAFRLSPEALALVRQPDAK